MKKYFITTPIYYANAKIHFWNLYTTLIADVIARSKRLLWYDVFFSTGTDENGQKMIQSAAKEWKSIQDFLDDIVAQDKAEMKIWNISYDEFIRTTDPRHHKLVQSILQKTHNNWDLYQWEYEWLYCIGCESFKKEGDLIEKDGQLVCPDHLVPPQKIKEKNRFFRLSDYEEKLKSFYKKNPQFIQPQYRYNEVLSFVESGLEDFSISRPAKTNSIGIPLPFDKESITYIWYDALLNYLTVIIDHYDSNWTPIFKEYGHNMYHTIGKDIVRFHAIYWPAMLMAAGYEDYLPKWEFVGGFFTVNGQKMSKSLWNTLYIEDLINEYWRDASVFYLLYDIPQWADWDFSLERLGHVYESMLLWWRWNLVSRVTKLAHNNWVTQAKKHHHLEHDITMSIFESYIDNSNLQWLVKNWYQLVQDANNYMQTQAPWTKLKSEETYNDWIADLEHLLWIIKQLTLLSASFLTESFSKLQQILWIKWLEHINSDHNLTNTDSFSSLYTQTELEVNLHPTHVYQPK